MTSSPHSFSLGAGEVEGPGSLAIAIVLEHANPLAALDGVGAAGQDVHVARLADALADRGHRVTLYVRRDSPDLPDRVSLRDGVEVRHVPAGPPEPMSKEDVLPHMGDFGRRLARVWQVRPPDLVHTHFWVSGLASLRAVRELGLPLLHTYHALGTAKRRHQRPTDGGPSKRIAQETQVGLGCDRIIATCRAEVAELRRMGIPARKVSIVPRGVDTELFTPRGPVAERGAHRHQLLQLGSLVPHEGTAVAVAALALLPGTELVLVGGPPRDRLDDDPEVRRLRRIAQEAGVADRLRFTGGMPAQAVPPLLRAADVVVCPEEHEPFGIVPLEAMACGKPVVASAVGGHLDTVVDPGTGRLVPPGDPEALARSLGELLSDPGVRAACGEAGRRRVLRRFGWGRVAVAAETAYCTALDARPAALGVI
jgi:glycosyltransferase involved in cell wall biosynthesis